MNMIVVMRYHNNFKTGKGKHNDSVSWYSLRNSLKHGKSTTDVIVVVSIGLSTIPHIGHHLIQATVFTKRRINVHLLRSRNLCR